MIRKKTDFDPINGNIERVGCLKNFHDLMSIEDRNAVLKKFFRIDFLIDKKIKINALSMPIDKSKSCSSSKEISLLSKAIQ